MNQPLFWIGAAILAIVFSILACWANASAGVLRLIAVTVIAMLLIFGAGVVEWQAQLTQETPLLTYALLAIVPPALAAATIYALATRTAGRATQVLAASVVGFLMVPVTILSAFFP